MSDQKTSPSPTQAEDIILVETLKFRPLNEEDVRYLNTGLWPIKEITYAEAIEMFPGPNREG